MSQARRLVVLVVCLGAGIAAGFTACRSHVTPSPRVSGAPAPPPAAALAGLTSEPCVLALAPQQRSTPSTARRLDDAIERLQQQVHSGRSPVLALTDLGQQFIAKARTTRDHSYYQRAEASAACAELIEPGNAQALLLRGHVLHQAHRFKEAEGIARQVVAKRGLFLDYGLLGDALMEQGKLQEAGEAYQRMMDLKPFYHSYTRAAHLRWLQGDLQGAVVLMRMAVKAASPRDPEAVAWAYARLAQYELQSHRLSSALEAVQAALTYQPDYPAALLVRGRTLLAQGKAADAVAALRDAAIADPLPEYQWALAEALQASGRVDEARALDASIERIDPTIDPRTLALYLATRGTQVDVALSLAQREMNTRGDVFTLDALAWSLAAAGRAKEADTVMTQALGAGTSDARLFYHAGVIAAAVNDPVRAKRMLRKALALPQMLLPSEHAQALRVLARPRAA